MPMMQYLSHKVLLYYFPYSPEAPPVTIATLPPNLLVAALESVLEATLYKLDAMIS